MLQRALLLLTYCMSCSITFGQPDISLSNYKSKYPKEDCVLLNKKESVDIEMKDGKPKVNSSTYEEVYWLTDKAQFERKDAISYGVFDKLVNISAKSLVPENNKFKEFPVDKFDITDYIESGVFFDDIKVITYSYPKLIKGSKTVKQYENEINDLHFLTGFDFSSYMPVENSELTITLPQTMKLNYRLINCDNYHIQYSEEKKGQKVVHTWRAQNVAKREFEDNSPSSRYTAPHIIYYIENYKQNGLNFNVFSNLDNLYAWYNSLTENVKPENDTQLKKLVDSLTLGCTSELDKVKHIYYWVQDNIKYIAIEYGLEGFQPRPADLVYTRRYGDCKDMANLIYSLLKEADIPSHLTWVGTRDLPYSYKEIPTPVVDNHMIVTYINGDKKYFLDATGSLQPISLPSGFIQGKEALVGFGKGKYEVDTIPVVEASVNIRKDSCELKVDQNGKLAGNGITTYTGYYNMDFNRMVRGIKPDDLNKRLEKEYVKGSNKYHVLSNSVKNAGIRDSSAQLQYTFEIPDLVMKDDSNLYLNMILDKSFFTNKINKDRKTDYMFDFKGILENTVVFDIPAGYRVSHVPGNSGADFNGFGFTVQYKVYNNKVMCTTKITTGLLLLKKEQVPEWNSMITMLQNAYNSALVLKKN